MTAPHPIRRLRQSLAPVPVTYHVERYERIGSQLVHTASYDLTTQDQAGRG